MKMFVKFVWIGDGVINFGIFDEWFDVCFFDKF